MTSDPSPDAARAAGGSVSAARFAAIADALAREDGVSVGAEGSGFGAGSLQVNHRIFAMLSGEREVLKLPRARVQQLLAGGEGLPFDAGKGRPMKEWVAIGDGPNVPWLSLAREAVAFVGGKRSP